MGLKMFRTHDDDVPRIAAARARSRDGRLQQRNGEQRGQCSISKHDSKQQLLDA